MTMMAAIVKELIAAGVTGDGLVTALERIESAMEDPISAGALRQRRYRKRHEASHNVTGDAQKERPPTPPKEKPLPTLPFSDSSLESREESSGDARARGKSRATRLPDDWQPDEAGLAFAGTRMPAGRIPDEIEKFRDHWHAANGPSSLKRSWAAAWRTWCRRAVEFNGRRTDGKSVLAAADRLIDKFGGVDAARSYVPGSAGPAPLGMDIEPSAPRVQLISKR